MRFAINSRMAEEIWRVLVDRAGASDSLDARDSFVNYATGRGEVQEYRFMGHLGPGGKVRITDGKWIADCYEEDLNDLRRQIVANTNHALAELRIGLA